MACHSLSVCAYRVEIAPCTFRCVRVSLSSVWVSAFMCMCHVFGIFMSFLMSPPSAKVLSSGIWGGGGWGYLGVTCGDPSQALAALRLTNGLLLSVCDKPGAGANISSLWHRSGCQQKAWHGINKARSRRKAAKCLEPSIRRWGYERRQLACVATCPAHAQMEDVKSLQMPYLKKTNATAERRRGKEKEKKERDDQKG